MPNQCGVVLTDEEIRGLQTGLVFGVPDPTPPEIKSARTKFKAAVEHPEGITDEQVGRALAKGGEFTSDDDGFQAMRACLEAALSGDGEL